MSNDSIKCSVDTCMYNDHKSYCTLDSIMVGEKTTNAQKKSETECDSFVAD